jgi:hypothetical protein
MKDSISAIGAAPFSASREKAYQDARVRFCNNNGIGTFEAKVLGLFF